MDPWQYRILERYFPSRVMGVHARSPFNRMYMDNYREVNNTPVLSEAATSLIGSGPDPATESTKPVEPIVAEEKQVTEEPEEMTESLTSAQKRAIEEAVESAKSKAISRPLKVGSFKADGKAVLEDGAGATKPKRQKLDTLQYLQFE